MANEPTVSWKGKSGVSHTYWVYPIGTTFSKAPGNYIFTKRDASANHTAIYVGQTGDLNERFDSHERMPCITKNGATHICVHKSSESEKKRCAEESDLIANYKPICNRTP